MPDADLSRLLAAHRGSGILVDINLLLLFLIGKLDRRLIEQFKRTKTYSKEDYDWLAHFLDRLERVIKTPTILAEVYSFANQLHKNKDRFFAIFAKQIELLDERYAPSKAICKHTHFARCGLTDTAIM
jgi:hypothetical protein